MVLSKRLRERYFEMFRIFSLQNTNVNTKRQLQKNSSNPVWRSNPSSFNQNSCQIKMHASAIKNPRIRKRNVTVETFDFTRQIRNPRFWRRLSNEWRVWEKGQFHWRPRIFIVIRIRRSVDGDTSRPVLLPSGMIYDHKTMRVFQSGDDSIKVVLKMFPTRAFIYVYIPVARVHEVGLAWQSSMPCSFTQRMMQNYLHRLLTDKPGLRTSIRRREVSHLVSFVMKWSAKSWQIISECLHLMSIL